MSESGQSVHSDWSIRSKLLAAFGAQIVLLLVGCVAFVWTQHQLRESRSATSQASDVIALIEQIRADSFEQVAGLRAYSVTGYKAYLDANLTGRDNYTQLFQQLERATATDAGQQTRVVKLAQLLGDWRDQIADPALRAARDERNLAQSAEILTSRKAEVILQRGMSLLEEMLDTQKTRLAKLQKQTDRFADIMLVLIIALVAVGLLLGLIAGRSLQDLIATPLRELAELVPQLAQGKNSEIPYTQRDDEVGALASGFVRFRDTNIEQRRLGWVREHSSRLISVLQTADTEAEFGQALLQELCVAVDAGYGLAYGWDERAEHLAWRASYGVAEEGVRGSRFERGEGLIGEAMAEDKLIELSTVPPGYQNIVSGLGVAAPVALVFVPLSARGRVVAVLELGLVEVLDQRKRDLIEQVRVTVALAWEALSRSLRTRELLRESQAQSEELQASEEALRVQQEQLRSVNEALSRRSEQLEAQGRQLKSSEENLRAQTEELRSINAAMEENTEALRLRQSELEAARMSEKRRAVQLEQASRYKSEFLANMSHELRTPLNSMLILSKTLADNLDNHLDSEEVESAQIIHDSGQSLLQLINDILDLSKVEAGKMDFESEDVDLEETLSGLVKRFNPLAMQKGLECSLRISDNAPRSIHTDPKRLLQVMTNLLSNAFKFTEKGKVEICVSGVDGGVALEVRDSGIGIPKDHLQRVFEAFEQAESGTSRRFGGTGLGLSIVNGITTRLGGAVRVSSVEGQGSVFTVYLPLHRKDGVPAAANSSDDAVRIKSSIETYDGEGDGALKTAGRTTPSPQLEVPPPEQPLNEGSLEQIDGDDAQGVILIVEDDEKFAGLLARTVRQRGHQVAIAHNGAQALEISFSQRLAAVLLDIGLPDMNGLDVLEQLKADSRTMNVPVHIVSGRDPDPRGAELGAATFLQKPVSSEQVLAALGQIRTNPSSQDAARLLVVVQDPVQLQSLSKLLHAENIQVDTAGNLEDALEALGQKHFDGMIVDPDLPDGDAIEFLQKAAGRGKLPPSIIYAQRSLSSDESNQLREFASGIVIHGTRSKERLLDEVNLFLHSLHRGETGRRGGLVADRSAKKAGTGTDLSGKTILVVDDDMRNVFALSKALRAHGLKVVMAQDGNKALSQLKARNDISLVLMDIMMPGMDGYETTRRIRENPAWEKLPVIAVTAKAMAGDKDKCIRAGANDYCPKPIDVDKLLSQIQVWV
tara:strand:+ start:3194 stop:6853 length:3660 start_codon:yes stop_codon:yes gene_type:complete